MFRNLIVYRIKKIDPDLEASLKRMQFNGCPPSEPLSRGFTPPRGNEGVLVESISGYTLFQLSTETKVLPADAVARKVEERRKAMEKEQGFPPGRKQTRELKESITLELLPNALTKMNRTRAFISGEYLCIEAATATKAEALLECLRQCCDALEIALINTAISPTSIMSDWLAAGDAKPPFTIDRDCELKAADEDQAAVRYAHHSLEGEEIKAHLTAGKLPTKLALTWNDRVSFVLTDRGDLKRIALLDVVQEQTEGDNAEDLFDSQFTVAAGELTNLLNSLYEAMGGLQSEGGENVQQGI